MDELLVIDKILDFIVPVKLRGKHMGVVMERGVKLLFLGVVTVIAAEGILRKTARCTLSLWIPIGSHTKGSVLTI